MIAKQKFIEFGYYEQESCDECIDYCRDILDKETYGYIDSEIISFDISKKNIYLTNKNNLTYDEIKCILKKMLELGWNKC